MSNVMSKSINTPSTSKATKRIILDYKELLDDPVENIYYIQDEDNVYKGYALIIGPKDTPYEYGYYLFEFVFPENYPFSPPKVKFHTYDGHTRFNPNLYINGYVCLSILNTWEGEKWSACQSIKSILHTLSITLNETPLLNEPGITIQHKDFKAYNQIIAYKNIEIAILKYLDISNIPFNFHHFFPIIIEQFKKNYDGIINNCRNKENCALYLTVYNNMSANIEYNVLLTKLTNNYNNIKN
jgi:ubiquitin-conjugating enzyme E2 Z